LRNETPLYQAWCIEWSSKDVKSGDRHSYGALDVKTAAELHARNIGRGVPASRWPSVVTVYVKDPLDGDRVSIVELGKITTHDFHAQRATKGI